MKNQSGLRQWSGIERIQTKEFKLIIESKWRRIFKINFITLEQHRNIQSKNNRFSKYTLPYRIYASRSIYQQDVLNLSWYLHRTFCMIKTYLYVEMNEKHKNAFTFVKFKHQTFLQWLFILETSVNIGLCLFKAFY